MQFFRKREEHISRTEPGFEETERRTPKTGIILLLAMVIAGLFFGWRALDDLGRIPDEPARLSECSFRYRKNIYLQESSVRPYSPPALYYEHDSSQCVFGKIEKAHNIPSFTEKRISLEKKLKPISDKLNEVHRALSEVQGQISRLTGEYGVGLQEKQAGIQKPLFPIEPSGQSIESLRPQEASLLSQKAQLESEADQIRAEIKLVDEQLKEAYRPVFKEQNKLLRWYEFKVFLLQLLFIIPFFLLVFWGYLRLHRKNSPYTIIFTAMVAVGAILSLQVFLFWFWGLFLERVLEIIWEWMANYKIVRSLIFYGGMIFSFILFGGAVYYLQKKIFDPRRVALRRFRQNQCPRCQTSLDLSEFYCPNCGHQIKEKCPKCGNPRFIELPSCPSCGNTMRV